MSLSLARKTRAQESEAERGPSGKPGASGLRIGARDDAFEREADRVAHAVTSGSRIPNWSFGKVQTGLVQRQPTPEPPTNQPTPAPQPNNYKEGAEKLGEAFLATDLGKELKKAAGDDPLVKGAGDFIDTLPGKIVAGAAAAGAVSALAATHKSLPAQIPEIPLDKIRPGLKVKVTYEGPVDHPTKAMVTFSYTPQGDKKKSKETASERYRAGTAHMAAEMENFRAGMKYAPGSPQAQQQEADQKMTDDWAVHRFGSLPGTGGRPLTPAPGAGQPSAGGAQPSGSQWSFSPLAHPELDNKLGLQPLTSPSVATKPDANAKKEEELPVQRKAENNAAAVEDRDAVEEVLHSPGRSLDRETRGLMESRMGFDFSKVRVHTDPRAAESARSLNAEAYTVGSNVVFGQGKYDPFSTAGQSLLAHELTHVAQQDGRNRNSNKIDFAASSGHELEAERVASTFKHKSGSPCFGRATPARAGTLQRKIAMRDVGRGEQSGFARVPELIDRLNAMSAGLTFALTGSDLTYTVKPGGTLNNFDTQMQGFIDQAAVIPLRFTNRHGLLGSRATGFNDSVTEDAWSSGYVDIDDLLASSDLGMQTVLVHFLRERTATTNYARRIGSTSLETDPATAGGAAAAAAHQAEFDRAHAQGIQAELQVLRDFFSDPTIRLIDPRGSGQTFRVFRNGRGDAIRTRVRPGRGANAGVDAVSIEVVTRDGRVHTPDEYKALLAAAPPPAAAGAGAAAAAPP